MTATAAAPRIPDGYTLIDRLGAGGYGEVWRATAPGGVEKAVKVVFGHCDADLADRERKSLERVRSVRHPFLLTIERYEVVENRLIIVTELADTSLDQLFRNYRAKGDVGLPRDLLLRLLADSAEALDCLSEKHNLQHLDVKPENLLLVGDHVKVADYGLVKQLSSRTQQSMVGGMTPLYSAPEVFDGAPTRSSDQYSLAIVFQYMLTGMLPFSGQTVSQLVKQHTMADPNVGPLAADDRRAVLRALSKTATDRFGSCREFVQALSGAAPTPVATATLPTASTPSTAPSPDDTKSVLAISTQPLQRSEPSRPEADPLPAEQTQPLAPAPRQRRDRLPVGPSDVSEVSLPDGLQLTRTARPTLFVGLGGVGARMLAATRTAWTVAGDHAPVAEWLVIDTDRDQLRELRAEVDLGLAGEDTLHTALRRSKDYRNADPALLRGVTRRWLYNIPRSLATRGFRPLGRVALLDNAERVARSIAAKVRQVASADRTEPIRVVLLAGGCGGTGSGMIVDLAQAIHSVADSESTAVRVEAVLGLPTKLRSSDKLGAASLVSMLIELAHSQSGGNRGASPIDGWISRFESENAPFDRVNVYAAPDVQESLCDAAATGLLAGSLFDLDELAQHDHGSELGGYQVVAAVDCDRMSRAIRSRCVAKVGAEAVRLLRDVDPAATMPPQQEAPENEQASKASAADRRRNYQSFLDRVGSDQGSDEPEDDVALAGAAREVVDRFVRAALGDQKNGPPFTPEALARQLKILVQEAAASVFDEGALVDRLFAAVEVDPVGCGYRRQTVAICPSEGRPTALLEALKSSRPELAIIEADAPHTMLVCLGRGLEPRFLAAQVEGVFPDVVEAAERLHTRADVDWGEL